MTPEEIHDFTINKLADFKRPRYIHFIEEMPINPTGKVDKKNIRAKYLDQE